MSKLNKLQKALNKDKPNNKSTAPIITDVSATHTEPHFNQAIHHISQGNPLGEPEMHTVYAAIDDIYAVEQVRPDEDFDEENIDEMGSTYDSVGLLQPIRCYPRDKRGFRIWFGETRWRTAKKRGQNGMTILVGVPPKNEKVRILGQLIENIKQSGLKPLAQAKAFQELINDWGMSVDEIAKSVGKKPSYVSKHLKLVDAPDYIVKLVKSGITSDLDKIYTVCQVAEKSEEAALKLVDKAVNDDLTRDEAKQVLKELKEQKPKSNKIVSNKLDEKKNIVNNEKEAKQVSGSLDVIVSVNGKKGTLLLNRLPEDKGMVWVKFKKGDDYYTRIDDCQIVEVVQCQ